MLLYLNASNIRGCRARINSSLHVIFLIDVSFIRWSILDSSLHFLRRRFKIIAKQLAIFFSSKASNIIEVTFLQLAISSN